MLLVLLAVADAQITQSICAPANLPSAILGRGSTTIGWAGDIAISPSSISMYAGSPLPWAQQFCFTFGYALSSSQWLLMGTPMNYNTSLGYGYDVCALATLSNGQLSLNMSGATLARIDSRVSVQCPPPPSANMHIFAPAWTTDPAQRAFDCASRLGVSAIPSNWQGSVGYIAPSPFLSQFVVRAINTHLSARVTCLRCF